MTTVKLLVYSVLALMAWIVAAALVCGLYGFFREIARFNALDRQRDREYVAARKNHRVEKRDA